MDKDKIRKILSAPVSFIRPSNEKERVLFPDEKEGWFYTFGLASGQQFVGFIPDDINPRFHFRPVPEHNFLPELREIQYDYNAKIYYGPGPIERKNVRCLVSEGVSLQDKEFYDKCSGAKESQDPAGYIPVSDEQKKQFFAPFHSHQLYEKAVAVKDCLVDQREAQHAISVAEKTMNYNKNKLMCAQTELNKILTHQETNQQIQQKLNERRQNG